MASLLCGGTALLASLGVYALIDVTLGTVFASAFVAGLVSIAAGPTARNVREVALVSAAIAIGASAVLLLAISDQPSLAWPGVQLLSLLVMLSAMTISATGALSRLIGEAVARAMMTIALLAWLAGPAWFSPWFGTPMGAWMIDHAFAYHPLMSLNGAYSALGDWSHSPIAYKHLTNLGQDVLFDLPPNVWKSAALHGAIALAATTTTAICSQFRRRKDKLS